MFVTNRLAIAALIILVPTLSFADVVVSHFEPIQQIQLSKTGKDARSFGPEQSQSALATLRFDALGRTFDLQLEVNDRIAPGLNASGGASSIDVYRGQLANNPDSWARIVVFEGAPRGLIWDGTEMFALEAPGDSAVAVDSPVIYRLTDAHIVSGTMSCGADFLSGNAAAAMQGIVASTKAALARAPGAVSEISMSAIGDFDFTQARGSDAAATAAIVTRMSNVDGYFSEQVGVQLTLDPDDIELIADAAVPFGPTLVSDDLLDELSEYRLATDRHNTRGLTHLFTGKNLAGTTVGVAWRGTLCSREFGSGLTEGRFGAIEDSLIAAHEIGHNFGAEHDGEAMSSCEAETGAFIMSASINGSDQFSDCSIDVMQASATAAVCVSALPTVDVGIEPLDKSGRVFLGVQTELAFEVSSNGSVNVGGVMANFTLPGILDLGTVTTTLGSCTSGAGTVDCDLGELAGLSVQTITLAVTPNSFGAGTLNSSASTTDADERPSNNQHALQLTVEEAVDLVVNVPTAASVNINQTATFTGALENNSDADATDVRLSVAVHPGLRADTATWSIGTCTVTPQQIDCTADVFPARLTSDLSITATALSDGTKDVTVVLTSSEADSAPANNTVVGEVVVTDPNKKSGGSSGGGMMNPFMILLGLLAIRRIRKRPIY